MAKFHLTRSLKVFFRNAPTRRFFARVAPGFLQRSEQRTVDAFHDLTYRRWQRGGKTLSSWWLGHRTEKTPLDLWIYQEIIVEQRPEVIIECGTRFGGSAMYLASVCDLVGSGRVISIDIDPEARRPEHPRITYVEGSSTADSTLARVRELVNGATNCMVILDSDHSRDHVRREMEAYRGFVPVGGYMVVEDTNVNGYPTYPSHGPGPMEAVHAYLLDHDDFEVDRSRERFLMTLNPCGYLKRVR
ncbi:MAG: CmcI family methyltransferase [Gemmatimonas sp.]